MRISDQFPSNYIRATDLNNREVVVTMKDVINEKVGDDTKPVLYFEGKEKGMVLNKTNADTIAQLYGDDTDDWVGEAITLFSAVVSFQGKNVPAVRVKAPSRKKAAEGKKPAPAAATAPEPPVDDIPF